MLNTPLYIWYAEDDEEDRLIFRECISGTQEVVKLKEFSDGSALTRCLLSLPSEQLPDAIISDMKMPIADGADILKFIRVHAQFTDIPVIIFSTSSSSFDKNNCLELGAKAYFSKPSIFSDIKLTVYEMLSLCRQLS